MPDTPSITIVKQFNYRGVPEEYANTYHFSGDTPAGEGAWATLAEALWNEERKMLNQTVKLAAAFGYVAGNETAVFTRNAIDQPPANPLGLINTADQAPGDAAFWVRWKTDAKTSKNKPIYLRKYFHGFATEDPDTIGAATRAAAVTYAGKMTDGTLPGNFRVCGPQGAVAGAAKVPTFVTTRTLKRRGKDPS